MKNNSEKSTPHRESAGGLFIRLLKVFRNDHIFGQLALYSKHLSEALGSPSNISKFHSKLSFTTAFL